MKFYDTVILQLRNWKMVGWIKSLIVLFFAFPILLKGVNPKYNVGVGEFFKQLLGVAIMGFVAMPLFVTFFAKIGRSELVKPNWNDNPYFSKNFFLICFHFSACLIGMMGVAEILGTFIIHGCLILNGVVHIALAVSLWLGINRIVSAKARQVINAKE